MARSKIIDALFDSLATTPTAYRIEWAPLVRGLLPPALRRPRQVAWLRLLTTPLGGLHQQFVTYLFASRREASYNSQVLLFERALNDRFDSLLRRIRIRSADTEYAISYDNFRGETPTEQYLYQRREWPPANPTPSPRQGSWEYDRLWREFSGQTDFVVEAPAYLAPRAAEIRALIRRLKLATKQYRLVFPNALSESAPVVLTP